jgi:putative N-acetyltransferase (TIGR04045 family)
VLDIVERLGGPAARDDAARGSALIVEAGVGSPHRDAYLRLRRCEFVESQGLFSIHDCDAADADARTRVLVAVTPGGDVIGGVRLHPETAPGRPELGWWRGSRLVVNAGLNAARGAVGAALVRAACAHALERGALRFDAHVQSGQERFFSRLGWETVRPLTVAGRAHVLMRWPVDRFERLVAETKQPLGELVGGLLRRDGWLGDDGVPVPGSDVVACTDAITPAMVQRDPEWAGWCAMLVTAHDLAAMGATPLGALDALAAPDADHAGRVVAGVRRATEAFALPVLGGHTQLGGPASLAVTGLGRAPKPVAAGGGQAGDVLTLTADVEGGWRPGYSGAQWDSTSWRSREELAPMLSAVADCRPRAAKDVSMAGIVGTAGMLAEASGTGVELEAAAIPRPDAARFADWLTCFPGMAFLTADTPGAQSPRGGAARSAHCGRLTGEPGVRLRWPDGDVTTALPGAGVSGLGAAVSGPGPAVAGLRPAEAEASR